MAAATPTPLYSNIFRDPSQWRNPNPDYTTIVGVLGGGAGTDQNAAARAAVNMAAQAPVVFAMSIEGSGDYVYVGHSATTFPQDLTETTPYDNHVVMLTGNNVDAAVPIVLPPAAFARLGGNSRTHTLTGITGAAGHGHPTAAVYRTGPHGNGVPDTHEHRLRRVMIMPPTMAERALTLSANGRYTLLAFYQHFIQPEQADPARQAAARPLTNWWLGASTNDNHGHTVVRVETTVSADPINLGRLNQFVGQLRTNASAKLGLGGPLLTAASFTAGVAALQNTMTQNTTDMLTMEREKKTVTVTKKLGDGLAELLHRYCNVTTDAALPEAHTLAAKSEKGRLYAVINNLLQKRAQVSPVYLTAQSPPLAVPKVTDEIFRNIRPANAGTEFALGNTPFAMVCGHHIQANKVHELIKNATFVESGAGVSLEDAQRITTSDSRFPSNPSQASDQICAWSVMTDIFHGVEHPISRSIRRFALSIAGQLSIVFELAGAGRTGMDTVGRIMYEAQQDYFQWCHKTAAGEPNVAVPTFQVILDRANSNRASSLSALPAHWYHFIEGGKTPSVTPQQSVGATSTFNANADPSLLKRFKDSGHSTISSMIAAGGDDIKTPKHSGKEVCLTWALKGRCNASCKRKNMHMDYGVTTNKKIHELMDQCGVATPRP